MSANKTVLIIENNPRQRAMYEKSYAAKGYGIMTMEDLDMAAEILKQDRTITEVCLHSQLVDPSVAIEEIARARSRAGQKK